MSCQPTTSEEIEQLQSKVSFFSTLVSIKNVAPPCSEKEPSEKEPGEMPSSPEQPEETVKNADTEKLDDQEPSTLKITDKQSKSGRRIIKLALSTIEADENNISNEKEKRKKLKKKKKHSKSNEEKVDSEEERRKAEERAKRRKEKKKIRDKQRRRRKRNPWYSDGDSSDEYRKRNRRRKALERGEIPSDDSEFENRIRGARFDDDHRERNKLGTKYINEREIDDDRLNEIDDEEADRLDNMLVEYTEKVNDTGKTLEELDALFVPNTIIIRNLPDLVTNSELWTYFRPFGPIAIVRVCYDRVTGASRRFGFIEFERDITVDQILAKSEHVFHGTVVTVMRAARPKDTKIYVGDLPNYIKNKELTEYFEQFGKVTDIVWPRAGQPGRNFCFVFMNTETEAELACKKSKVTFGDREVSVARAAKVINLDNSAAGTCEIIPHELFVTERSLYSGSQWMGRGGDLKFKAMCASALTSFGRSRQKREEMRRQQARREKYFKSKWMPGRMQPW